MTELLEWWHAGQTFIGTPQQLVDELGYANYRYNRQRSPQISPQEWEKIYGAKAKMWEERYQYEQPSHG